jgi:hypothetical protein
MAVSGLLGDLHRHRGSDFTDRLPPAVASADPGMVARPYDDTARYNELGIDQGNLNQSPNPDDVIGYLQAALQRLNGGQ